MAPSNIKTSIICVLLLWPVICFAQLKGPKITALPGPFVFELDATGHYKLELSQLATITPDTPGLVPYVTFTPSSFDCVLRGQQNVVITASDSYPSVSFANPTGIAKDAAGNFYISDAGNHKIRKIALDGAVTDVAGSGIAGSIDGPAADARFDEPEGIGVDARGNIFVADAKALVVREITPNGQVITIAGMPYDKTFDFVDQGSGGTVGFAQPYGIAIDPAGNIFVTDAPRNLIRKINTAFYVTTFAGSPVNGTEDGTGTQAKFFSPYGIVCDKAGNLYVADTYNQLIRKVTPAGVVTTICGKGSVGYTDGPANTAEFNDPVGITIGDNNNIYVSDLLNEEVRKVAADGTVSTFAGYRRAGDMPGQGTLAMLSNPRGLVIGSDGNIYLADVDNNKIKKITPGGLVSDYAGTGVPGNINGNIHRPANDPISTKTIPITIATVLKIKTVFKDIDLDACTITMPDFTKGLVLDVEDNCNDNIVPHQSPAAGTPLKIGANTVYIIIEDATGKFDSASFKATVKMLPNPPAVSISPSIKGPVCTGTPITFTADAVNAGTPTYQWLLNGNKQNSATNAVFNSVFNDGDIVSCDIVSSVCPLPASSGTYTVSVKAIPTVSFDNSSTIIKLGGKGEQLNPIITGDVQTYKWLPADGLSADNIPNPVANPRKTTTYQLTVTSPFGCSAPASKLVTVIDNIVIPNTFTPNGDGINDTWVLTGSSIYPNCSVEVYNRYGAIVYHSVGYPAPWDGKLKGRPLAEGTYYYVVDLKTGAAPFTGGLTIIR